MVPIILLLLLFLVPRSGHSAHLATYGPSLEVCTTTGTQVSGAGWEATIEAMGAGSVALLRAGTYTMSSGTFIIPASVTVKPYNCEAVTLSLASATAHTGQAIELQNGSVLAGITVTGSATLPHANLICVNGRSNATVRNNVLTGGSMDSIMIKGATTNFTLQGNDINGSHAKPSTAPNSTVCGSTQSASGGHNLTIIGESVNNITIKGNKIRGEYFGDVKSSDDVIAVDTGANNVVIENNWFLRHYNIEDVIDLKSDTSETGVIVRGNYFDADNFLGTKSGEGGGRHALILAHNMLGEPPAYRHTIERNFFGQSDLSAYPAGADRELDFISLAGGFTLTSRTSAVVRNNIFKGVTQPTNADTNRIQVGETTETYFLNNIFYRVAFRHGNTGGCPPDLTTLRNNIFYQAFIQDNTDNCAGDNHVYTHQTLFSTTGVFDEGTQSNNLTSDPTFANIATDDWTLLDGSPALNSGLFVNGFTTAAIGTLDRGVFESPTIGACQTVDNDTWECTVNVVFSPVIATCGSITPRRTAPAAVSGTASGCTVVNSTTVRFNVAGFTPANGDTLVVDLARGAVEDSALIGFDLRAKIPAVTGQAVTNLIPATAPTVASCVVGDTNKNKIQVTVDTKGSPPLLPATGCQAGWSSRDDGVSNAVTACSRIANEVLELTVTANFTVGVIDISYDPATGATTNNAGVEVASATNLACTNNVTVPPPTLVSLLVDNTNRDTFQIQIDTANALTPTTGITGFSFRQGGAALTVVQCDRITAGPPIGRVDCIVSVNITNGTAIDGSYSQASGNLTDGTTELVAFTNTAATNEVQSSTFTVTSQHARCKWINRAESSPRWHSAEDGACDVMPRGEVGIVIQLGCTGANCPAVGYKFRASDNGGAFYDVGNANADGTCPSGQFLCFTSDNTLANLEPTTRQLTSCTFTAGSVYEHPATTFPALAIVNGNCTEYLGVFRVSPDAIIGQTIVVRLADDPGTAVVHTVTKTINVVQARGHR